MNWNKLNIVGVVFSLTVHSFCFIFNVQRTLVACCFGWEESGVLHEHHTPSQKSRKLDNLARVVCLSFKSKWFTVDVCVVVCVAYFFYSFAFKLDVASRFDSLFFCILLFILCIYGVLFLPSLPLISPSIVIILSQNLDLQPVCGNTSTWLCWLNSLDWDVIWHFSIDSIIYISLLCAKRSFPPLVVVVR